MVKLSTEMIIPLKDIKGIDKVAHINPMMIHSQYQALLLDIKTNGQLEAITICRGLIIDGRNRFKAVQELGLSGINVVTLPVNTSINYKKEYVMQKEKRRHQTVTQLTCVATIIWNSDDKPNITQKEFIKKQGVSQGNFTNAQWIYKNEFPLISELKDGKKYKLDGYKTTDSLTTIVKDLKIKQKESIISDSDAREYEFKGQENFDQEINEAVNYYVNGLLRELNRIDIPEDEMGATSKDIAVTFYKMFMDKSKASLSGRKKVTGSKIS